MRREVTFRNAPSAAAPINSVWSEHEGKPEISGPTYPTSAGLYSNSDLRPTFTRQIFRAFRYQILCALRVFSSANLFPGRAEEHHITDRFLRSSDRHFFIEPSASICMRAILRCSVESDRMRSMTSFSSRILDRDFRPGAGPCTSASIGTSNASAIRIRVSSEGRAWARSRLLRLADVRLIRSAKFSWVKPLARRAARMAAAICSLRALSMPQVGLWKAEYHKVDFMFSLENKLNLNYTLKLSENL